MKALKSDSHQNIVLHAKNAPKFTSWNLLGVNLFDNKEEQKNRTSRNNRVCLKNKHETIIFNQKTVFWECVWKKKINL